MDEENNFLLRFNSGVFEKYDLSNISNDSFSINSFCLIPYVNSKNFKIQPQFYSIKNKSYVDLDRTIAQEQIVLKGSESKADYIKNVNYLKQQIQLGNVYEVNYCIEFNAECADIDPLTVYLRLNEIAKAPYSYLVKINNDFIICASPELFLKKSGNILYTKPIKGTAKRGVNQTEDDLIKNTLFNNLKERTENVMAVDVARNDLSKIAKRGSVSVNKLYNIETYETVHQMVSTVSCDILENTNFGQIIDATFPMASMTGAPKISAMDLIEKNESFKRNNYSGAMGVIESNGDFELSVNIRSIFYNQKTRRLSIAVGSAITHLCDPETEYEECLLKAKALLSALNAKIQS